MTMPKATGEAISLIINATSIPKYNPIIFQTINKMEQEIVKQTYVNSPGQKAPYRRPSIKIIEVEVQQLITASDVQSVQSTNWQPETDEGEITDGSGN